MFCTIYITLQQIHYRYITDTLQIHCRYITDTLQIHNRYITDTLQIHYRYITDTLQIHNRYITDTLQIHNRYITDTLYFTWVDFQVRLLLSSDLSLRSLAIVDSNVIKIHSVDSKLLPSAADSTSISESLNQYSGGDFLHKLYSCTRVTQTTVKCD